MNPYSPLKAHAESLRIFWQQVNAYPNLRKMSTLPKDAVISELRKMGDIFIFYSIKAPTPAEQSAMRIKAREKFDRLKDIRGKYRFKKGDECLACGESPNVRHHIIWLKNGGRNVKRNIAFLCNDCHVKVHPWLEMNQSTNNIK